MDPTTIPPPQLDDLVARWRSSAHVGGWRAMGDWAAPPVRELAAAAASGGSVGAPSQRLGRARAIAGVGIAEGLDDLERLWHLLGDAGAPAGACRAFAEGWADTIATPAPRPVRDPASGLATADVLRIRIDDLARTARTETCALVLVDVVDAALPRFARHLEVAAVGALVTETLVGAESPVRLAADRVAAIVPRDGELDEGVIRLRRALRRRAPDRELDGVSLAALPVSTAEVDDWLATR